MNVSYRFNLILTTILVSGFGLVCIGQQAALAQTTTTKTLNGEVSGVLNDSIAIVYKQDTGSGEESETLFSIDETVQFVGRPNIKAIHEGDTVSVTYEETVGTDEDGKETKSRKLLSIKFLKAAPVEVPVPEEAAEPALTSESPQP